MRAKNHLLIDGYNVIHQWPDFAEYFHRDPAGACDHLVETVRVIHDIDNYRVTVVFDGRGAMVDAQFPGNIATFAVLYSPSDLSADGLIEQIVKNAKDPKTCTVVSRDNLIAESIRASGGFAIRPDDLRDWVARCDSRSRQAINQRQKQVKKQWKEKSPWDALDGLK
ncbi:NYN domain-containing protein [Cerasicoccus fimbriatus]|uniref:NYN domain-containing protein n=1 Tax=Cerasicoccus fimbriatus TaxID=3014554 RepID=UPI0022B4EFCF|nr:NYN domain-containing protein [Cerasicoccus sp. TK19100]